MKTHRNLTLGLFACLFLLGSCTDSEIVDQKTGGSIATKAVANTDVILHCVYVPQLSYPFIC